MARRVKHAGSPAVGNTTGDGVEISTGTEITLAWITVYNGSGARVYINLYNSLLADVTPGTGRLQPAGGLSLANGDTHTFPLEMVVQKNLSVLCSPNADGTGASPTATSIDVAYESG